MRTLLGLAAPVAALALAGCHVVVHDGSQDWPDEDPAVADHGPGYACSNDGQCRGGCYCDAQARACHDSRACYRDSDCGDGFRCDGRATCVPRLVPPPATRDAGTPDLAARPDAAPPGADAKPAADAGAGAADSRSAPPVASCDGGVEPGAVPVCARCRFDMECGPGNRCGDGRCQHACTATTSCGTGEVCASGFCQPDTHAGGHCVYASDCGAGGTCINGYCHAACAPDRACPNRADLCDRGVCRPDVRPLPPCRGNADCGGAASCVDGVCRLSCGCDDDCSAAGKTAVCQRGFCFGADEGGAAR